MGLRSNETVTPSTGEEPPQLVWHKCENDRWCRLADLDLLRISAFGVYVLWHAGYPGRVVKVGYGDIAARLEADRHNDTVQHYGRSGPLFVTWAAADPSSVEGVTRHLADTLRPLISAGLSHVAPIPLNSPF